MAETSRQCGQERTSHDPVIVVCQNPADTQPGRAGRHRGRPPYREAISARLSSIRDFLLLFFFIDLGSKLDFSTLGDEIGTSVVLSLFVLIGNPLIVMAIMGTIGYRKRTSFSPG